MCKCGLKGQWRLTGFCFQLHTNEDWSYSVVKLSISFLFLSLQGLSTAKRWVIWLLWAVRFYLLCPAPASLHPLKMGFYESWHCVLPCSLLGFLSPTLSKAISFYLQYSSCLCTFLSSILHTLTQVLYFKGIKKWLYC